MAGHDIIVIGASAGGFVAIREILWRLPADLEAATFVAIHISREVGASFAENLGGKSSLPTCFAEDGEIYRNGRVYVAP